MHVRLPTTKRSVGCLLMQTLSVGQAARKSFRIFLDVRPALAWLGEHARAIDPSLFVLIAEGLLAALCYIGSVLLITQGRGAAWTISILRHTLGLAAAFPLGFSLAVQLHRR